MTESNEPDVRAALRAWARDVQPSAGNPADVMAEADVPYPSAAPRTNWARPVLWTAAAAAVGILALGVVTTREYELTDPRTDTPGDTVAGTAAPGSIPRYEAPPTTKPRPVGPLVSLGAPVVFHPPEPGWTVVGVWINRNVFTAIGLRHADGRRVALQLSEPAADASPSPLTGDTTPGLVRGQPAAVGNGIMGDTTVLSWEEAGHHWLLQILPQSPYFGGPDALVAFADAFEVVDHATFEAWLPPDMLAALHANPEAGSVNWEEGKPPQVSP